MLAVPLLSGCGGDTTDSDDAAAAPSTSTPSAASTTPRPTPSATPSTTAAPSPAPRIRFDTSMVRWIEVNKVNKGGQANAYVVAGVTDRDALLDVANECVEHYLDEQKAAFCHVWSTEANFAARDPQGVGNLGCWTHYVGVPLAGGDPVVTTSAAYSLEIEGCPDAG